MNAKSMFSSKRVATLCVLAGAVPLFVGCASVQPAALSIADALAVPDGTEVVVTGTVVQQMPDEEEILLQDASGQIVAEVDDDLVGEMQFGADTQLRVLGEIDRDEDRSVIVARSVQLVP